MRIEWDENVCASMGMCEFAADHIFQIGDDGALSILDRTPPESERAVVEEAVRSCPTAALSLVD